jgi:putative ABC transport system permease protein
LLARAPGRRRELGIRMAVGAPMRRLARQLATEAVSFVIVSALLGLISSISLSLYLRGLSLFQDAEWRDVTMLDWRVLGLAAGFLLVLTLVVSLAPMLGLKRLGIAASSHETTSRASLAQRLAGTVQIAVAGTLGGAAVAFAWYFGALLYGDSGYETGNLFLVDGAADIVGLNRDEIFIEFTRRREVIEAMPEVTAVAYGSPVPGGESTDLIPFPVRIQDPDDAATFIEAYTGSLDDRFIELLGFRLVHGRAPDGSETDGVLVNQTLAQALWGREDVVGERLPGDVRWNSEGADVLGVLEDISFNHPSAPALPYVFTVLTSPVVRKLTVIEADLTAAELQEALNRLTTAGTLAVEISNVRPLSRLRSELIGPDRARGLLTIASACLVILLAAFGFYGTQRYLVTAGRREYAIRASIGAGPKALGRLVIRRGLTLGLPGLVAGTLLAFIAVAWLRDDFVSRDVSAYAVTAVVAAGLVLLLAVASFGPARQAMRTQPAPLLREE